MAQIVMSDVVSLRDRFANHELLMVLAKGFRQGKVPRYNWSCRGIGVRYRAPHRWFSEREGIMASKYQAIFSPM